MIGPSVSTDFYRLKSKTIVKATKPGGLTAAKIKKNLFGTVDREENKRLV